MEALEWDEAWALKVATVIGASVTSTSLVGQGNGNIKGWVPSRAGLYPKARQVA